MYFNTFFMKRYHRRINKIFAQFSGSPGWHIISLQIRIRFWDPRFRNRFFPDPGSRISDPGCQNQVFESLEKYILGKITIILSDMAQNCFLCLFKNKIFFSFVIFMVTKKVGQQIFPPSSFVAVVGSGIRVG
jgi:hypothetical protein